MAREGASKGQGPSPGAVLHENLTLIEVDDPAALTALRADRTVGPLILTALSDRVAAVAPGRADDLLQRLRKAGHTPKVMTP